MKAMYIVLIITKTSKNSIRHGRKRRKKFDQRKKQFNPLHYINQQTQPTHDKAKRIQGIPYSVRDMENIACSKLVHIEMRVLIMFTTFKRL